MEELTFVRSRTSRSGTVVWSLPLLLLGVFSLPQLGPHWHSSPQQQPGKLWDASLFPAQGVIAKEGQEPPPRSDAVNAAIRVMRVGCEEGFMTIQLYVESASGAAHYL